MTIHFFLPGYAPRAVGGYRVVYDYAHVMHHSLNERVVIHHSPWPIFHSPTRLSVRSFAGLALRAAAVLVHRPRHRGVPWYPETAQLEMRFWLGHPRVDIQDDDVLVATSAHTAPMVNALPGRARRVYFIQHVETWSASPEFVDSTWRLPLHRIVIAPWLQKHGADLGVGSTLIPNAINSRVFPAGQPLARRRRQVLTMLSPLAFKRSDVAMDVYARLHEEDPSIALVAFGVGARPRTLPDFVSYVARPDRAALAALYRESRVYLCTSDAEGWHLPPGEALISGTSVVSTDIGGVRVVAGDDALYAAPGDAAGLCTQVRRMLDDEERAQELTDHGQSRLVAYTPEQAAFAFHQELLRAGIS